MTVLPRDLLLYAGGECLQRFGSPVWRFNSANPAPTLTRSGTVGSMIGPDSIMRDASANRIRTTWANGALYLLLEPAGTNAFDFSDDLSDASWTKQRTSVAANVSLISPKGVASASSGVYQLSEDSATGAHYFEQTLPALTDDTNQVTSFWARKSSRSIVFIQTINKAGRTDTTFFNLSTGEVGTADADHVSVRIDPGPLSGANRWYKVSVVWDAGSGGTTPRAILGLTEADGTVSYTGDGSSNLLVWNPMFEVDTDVPSSDIVTDSATDVTRNADTFTVPFLPSPAGLSVEGVTLYVKLRETGVSDVSGLASTVLNIGAASDFIRLYRSPGNNRYGIGSDISGQGAFPVVTAPEPGEIVEILGTANPDGSLGAATSVAGGSIATASESTTGDWPSAFGAEVVRFGSQSSSVAQPIELAVAKIARGVGHSIADMRAVFP